MENINLYSKYETFLLEKGQNSCNTKKRYKCELMLFFREMFNKMPEDITFNDLNSVEREDMIVLRERLIKEGKKGNTINGFFNTINKFYKYLQGSIRDGKKLFNPLQEKLPPLKYENNSYRKITLQEAEIVTDIMLEEKNKALTKYLLFKTAIRLSFRISALLSLTWDNFEKHGDIYVVTVKDKTGYVSNPIHENFYKELLKLKSGSVNSNKVFNISYKTVCKALENANRKLGLKEQNRITAHSFRGVASQYILNQTGDVKAAMRQSNHTNISNWWNHYMKEDNFYNSAGVLMDMEKDYSALESLTKEELLNTIKKCSDKTINEILAVIKDNIK